MIANERYIKILNLLNTKTSVTINEIATFLNISESTVRRDLNTLDKQKKLTKVHGGAISNKSLYKLEEQSIKNKKTISQNVKKNIAKKAASLIKENDIVFIDSGTTTYHIVNFLNQERAIYVTNSIYIAKDLIQKNFNVFILGGKIRNKTEAIVGTFATNILDKFNFTIGFFGTNGISLKNGYTTHDIEECNIKELAIKKTNTPYIICDNSKMNIITSFTFANLKDCSIITDKADNQIFLEKLKKQTEVLEV